MNTLLNIIRMGACALLLMAALPAQAQPMRTLTIHNGTVLIDDQPVPAADLPATLVLDGVTASFSFFGDVVPIIELNGTPYLLDGRSLREMTAEEAGGGGLNLFFRNNASPTPAPGYLYRSGSLPNDEESRAALLEEHARALDEHQRELATFGAASAPQQAELLERIQSQAQQAAQVAQALPRMEMQSYLYDVERQNQGLYDQLLEEWQMENEARVLAQRILTLPDGEPRRQYLRDLHGRLDAIFEIKQENRRREIQQLESELDGLHARLQKREALRERLIQRRLEELLGTERE